MSEAPRFQLGLFGGEEPALPLTAVRVAEEMIAAKPRREVSYEREMRAAQSTLPISLDPPDIEGWREDMAAVAAGLPGFERPRFDQSGVCTAIERWRRLEDGTIGPCPWVGCPRHNLLDYGAPVTIGGRRYAEIRLNRAQPAGAVDEPAMGRRPGLSTVPTDGEADDFALEALQHLDAIPETCTKDAAAKLRARGQWAGDIEEDLGGVETEEEAERAEVARADREAWRQRQDAARVREIAAVLGVSEEQVRLDTIAAAAKLGIRMVNGQPRPGDGARIEELMHARPASKPKIRRTWRGKVGAPPRAPAAIVREEREAPPVRERSADEIFTF